MEFLIGILPVKVLEVVSTEGLINIFIDTTWGLVVVTVKQNPDTSGHVTLTAPRVAEVL